MRNIVTLVLAVFCIFGICGGRALAAPPGAPADDQGVPATLKPWIPWVLRDAPKANCTVVNGSTVVEGTPPPTVCSWPSSLSLQLADKGGTFRQTWQVDAEDVVPLPGSKKHWPLDVRVDGKPMPVIERADKSPALKLGIGAHRVEGSFRWDNLPEAISAPARTGIVDLTVRGKHIAVPNIDASGEVFLSTERALAEDDHIDIVVHRLIEDTVPLTMQVQVTLQVSGKSREVLLGKSLPPGLIPYALTSPLPARLEADSRLRLQVRPGSHLVTLFARAIAPTTSLERLRAEGPWREGSEVWVFRAHSELRNVTIQGVSTVDPQQTRLPGPWKTLPAYLVEEGGKFELVVQPRPANTKAFDDLVLRRELWLDFDGSGFSTSDTVTATVRRATRLSALSALDLGRVSVQGADQFITTMGDGKSGVELRQGPLSLSSDARLTRVGATVPAVGYDEDVHRLDANLHLPPGWRLFHASGVDEVPSTWLRHWTLLELFLVIILTLASFRLWGPRAGALALVCFVLTFPEDGAPKWLWCFVLVAEALARAFRHVRLKRWLTWARHGLVVVVAIVTLPFAVEQVRGGLYPALRPVERTTDLLENRGGDQATAADDELSPKDAVPPQSAAAGPRPPVVATTPLASAASKSRAIDEDKPNLEGGSGTPTAEKPQEPLAQDGRKSEPTSRLGSLGGKSWNQGQQAYAARNSNSESYDPTARVQTGRGKPDWTWSRIPLHYSGPVERTQMMHLYLASPTVNLVLSVLRAAGLLLLLWLLRPRRSDAADGSAGEGAPKAPGGTGAGAQAAAAVILALGVLFAPSPATADEGPSPEILTELRSRLMKPPSCLPSCASAARLAIDATPSALTLRFEVHASAKIAVPVLGAGTAFRPSEVTIDGKPANALAREAAGAIWVALDPGIHQVVLRGALPAVNDVVIPLELKPHVTETHAVGWTLSGLGDDGASDDNLHLARVEKPVGAVPGEAATLTPSTLPPFLRVERMLRIGLNWRVTTVVSRVSSIDAVAVAEVPLLPGESITTADIRLQNAKVQVNLAPGVPSMSWESVLQERSPLVLTAAKDPALSEVWRLDLSNIWNARSEGLQAVASPPGTTLPEWRPFPGDLLTLIIERPKGVPGQVFTIDRSSLEVSPGLRLTEAKLVLQVRASRGMEHAISLPSGAVLDSATIAGVAQVLRRDGDLVVLPITPGSQTIVLNYHVPQGISFRYAALWPDLKAASVNARTTIKMSDARWILFIWGPRLGPSVLFWSLLLVLLALASALGRIKWVPMKTYEWMFLALGLSQVHIVAGALVVGWILLLGFRNKRADSGGIVLFNLRQLAIVLMTFVAAGVLVVAVHQGLLGHPDMQVRGNNSNSGELFFYEDRVGGIAQAPVLFSAPILVYRLVMLGWALWLASAVLRWIRWGFQSFGNGGMWRSAPKRAPMQQAQQAQQAHAAAYAAQQAQHAAYAAQQAAASTQQPTPSAAALLSDASLEPGQVNDVPLAPPRDE